MLALGKGNKVTPPVAPPLPMSFRPDTDIELAESLLTFRDMGQVNYDDESINFDAEIIPSQKNNVAQKVPIFQHFDDGMSEDVEEHKHDMRECDPAYDGHYNMSYYDNLWGKVTCIKAQCPNSGLTFGELIKKNIKVHYCKDCEEREGKHNCNHVICDVCMQKEDAHDGTNRRSKRRRK